MERNQPLVIFNFLSDFLFCVALLIKNKAAGLQVQYIEQKFFFVSYTKSFVIKHQFTGKNCISKNWPKIFQTTLYYCFSNIIFSRLENLLKKTNGKVLFQGGELDGNDLFIPPTILDITPEDIIMKNEVNFNKNMFDQKIEFYKEK